MLREPDVAIVVPTLGRRPEYLTQCLRSIRAAGDPYILMVASAGFDASSLVAEKLIDLKLDEVGNSLPAAIRQGFAALPDSIKYISWLGDDDLLRPEAITVAAEFLDAHPRSSLVYGQCDYIDEAGRTIWTNRSGWWASPLLRIGPDLIPQPGSLFRVSSYEKTDGLRTDLGWAFDLDIFLQLARVGKLSYTKHGLAAFRWHADSLSVGQRSESVREASQVRREFLPSWVRPIAGMWEGPVRWATYRAGSYVGGKKR